MLSRLIDFSLENRPFVLIAALLIVVTGGYAATRLPIDAVPDITNVQVQVLTKAPALGPVEMEQFVTYPVEAAMNGLPRLVEIRSISRYGLSAVTIVFEDGVDVYFARQLVAERLVQARESISAGFGTPEMGPVTTGLGDVFQFTVEGEGASAMERRTILDWMIAPAAARRAGRHRESTPGAGCRSSTRSSSTPPSSYRIAWRSRTSSRRSSGAA
jgi:cobalt-zinc-cadmium resistance protein CzcA